MSLINRKYKEHIISSKIDQILNMISNNELLLERCMKKNKLSQAEMNNQIRQALLNIKRKTRNNYVNVEYNFTIPGFGRVYAKKPFCSIGSLPREIRGTLACDYYVDIDVNNCHPVLLVQLCDKYKINCSSLRKYVNNREEYLQKVMQEYQCSRDDAKVLFLELMYGGSFQSWASSIGTDRNEVTWLLEIINDIKGVYPELLKHYTDQVKLLEDNGKPEKEYNRNAALVSWILQDTERQVLTAMIDYIARYGKGVANCILCFDGFMMLKSKFNPDLLSKLESEVKTKTGFIVKLSTKDFTTIDLIDLDEGSTSEYRAPPTDFFDIDVFNNCSHISWEAMKEYFERFACYNEDGDNIAFYNANKREIEFITDKMRKTRFANCLDHINLTKDGSPTLFINNWLKCTDRKTSHKINCIPYSGTFQRDKWYINGVINTYRGFNHLISTVNESYHEEFEDFYNNYFLKLLFNLSEQNEEYARWVLQFFAQMIQHPEQRVRRAIVLIGNQGDGKNALLDTFARVLGEDLFNTSSKAKDYFGDIASAHFNKILVNLDESQKSGNLDLEGMIKEFVTKATINVRQMYKDTFTADNYARLIVTTNKSTALPIDFASGDRRFVIFRTHNPYGSVSSDAYLQFWRKYIDVINSEWFPALMYEKLMSVDISDWNQNKEIITKQYEDTREMCGNSVDWFFDDKCKEIYDMASNKSNDGIGKIVSSELYSMYKEWCEDNGVGKPISSKYFKPDLVNNVKYSKFVEWHRYMDGRYFTFKLDDLWKYYCTLIEFPDVESNEIWTDDE